MSANTIEGLRINQWGIEAVAAQGTLTVATQPEAAHTFTIGAKVFTFVASGADEDGELNIGADLEAAKVNIVAAINGTDAWNDPHPLVTAADFNGDLCLITAKVPGTAGNAIIFTENLPGAGNVMNGGGTLGGTTLGSFARGTPVAATSKIAIEQLEWGDDDENIYRPQVANGLLIRNRGNATAVQHGTRFSFSDQPVIWEQLPHWLMMAITGTPAITGPGPNVWVFDRAPTTNPQPASFTFERRFSNGLGDTIDQQAAYAMISELTFRFAQNEHLRMNGAGFARKFNAMGGGITASLTLPTFELGVSALSTVYVDDAWADLGDTLLAEQVIGWELTIGTGLMPLATAEGRTTLDFTKHQINAGNVTLGLRLTVLLDPARYAIESAKAGAGDIRAVRIKVIGSGGRELLLDTLVQYTKPSLFKIGEQDGQDIVELELEEATDETNYLAVKYTHPTVDSVA
jgi:hypothetical protein